MAFDIRTEAFIQKSLKSSKSSEKIDKNYEKFSKNVFLVDELNSDETMKLTQSFNSKLNILAQSGIISSNHLAGLNMVINSHPGILPFYRGLDVVEWAIFNGDFDKLGCTLHQVDKGIDTGNIFYVLKYKIRKSDNLNSIKLKIQNMSMYLIVKFCKEYLQGKEPYSVKNTDSYPYYSKIKPEHISTVSLKIDKYIASSNNGEA